MQDSDRTAGQAAQETYWNQLVLLKVVACYVRRYRDKQAWWIDKVGLFKALLSSGTISAWVFWKGHAIVLGRPPWRRASH
jgi:hypothetical protein